MPTRMETYVGSTSKAKTIARIFLLLNGENDMAMYEK
jgi:hypothetical protein